MSSWTPLSWCGNITAERQTWCWRQLKPYIWFKKAWSSQKRESELIGNMMLCGLLIFQNFQWHTFSKKTILPKPPTNNSFNWEPSIQILEPFGSIFIQITIRGTPDNKEDIFPNLRLLIWRMWKESQETISAEKSMTSKNSQ